ncbi:MAG TPA: phosphatidylserine decarboxylase family protein [Candidatus Angelobacter sp.]|nr:phosphatidylserine decarboxylase family protein [Candidatus Angelobacter sp.]
MVRDGIYYALGMLVVAFVIWWLTHSAVLVLLPVLLAAFFLWFFRDPERVVPSGEGLIVSPADGKVTDVSATQLNGVPCTRISIFLNVFNVHVNRSPISGVIKSAVYQKGQFGNAMSESSAANNEQTIVTVEGEGMTVVFKQIAGVLARRIVFNHKPGETLVRGQRVGLIKFGSRTDVIFPQPAEIRVKVGDHVVGASTVLARVAVPQNSASTPTRERTGALR